jgi:hypothetical protein
MNYSRLVTSGESARQADVFKCPADTCLRAWRSALARVGASTGGLATLSPVTWPVLATTPIFGRKDVSKDATRRNVTASHIAGIQDDAAMLQIPNALAVRWPSNPHPVGSRTTAGSRRTTPLQGCSTPISSGLRNPFGLGPEPGIAAGHSLTPRRRLPGEVPSTHRLRGRTIKRSRLLLRSGKSPGGLGRGGPLSRPLGYGMCAEQARAALGAAATLAHVDGRASASGGPLVDPAAHLAAMAARAAVVVDPVGNAGDRRPRPALEAPVQRRAAVVARQPGPGTALAGERAGDALKGVSCRSIRPMDRSSLGRVVAPGWR